jgi:hypothetical protein
MPEATDFSLAVIGAPKYLHRKVKPEALIVAYKEAWRAVFDYEIVQVQQHTDAAVTALRAIM